MDESKVLDEETGMLVDESRSRVFYDSSSSSSEYTSDSSSDEEDDEEESYSPQSSQTPQTPISICDQSPASNFSSGLSEHSSNVTTNCCYDKHLQSPSSIQSAASSTNIYDNMYNDAYSCPDFMGFRSQQLSQLILQNAL